MQYLLFPVDAPQLRDSSRSDIRNGDAAEAFAIAKLLKWGFDAHDARRDSAYDIGVDLGHGLYCRVQVKSRAKATGARWGFRCVRGNPRTGVGSYAYGKNDYDVTACVALSMERVIFVPGVHPSNSGLRTLTSPAAMASARAGRGLSSPSSVAQVRLEGGDHDPDSCHRPGDHWHRP